MRRGRCALPHLSVLPNGRTRTVTCRLPLGHQPRTWHSAWGFSWRRFRFWSITWDDVSTAMLAEVEARRDRDRWGD